MKIEWCGSMPTLTLAVALLATGPAVAREPGSEPAPQASSVHGALDARTRAEARRRFDRGLALYNSGDTLGALAEFQLAHELTGHPLVLYNLALVHARLGQAAEAVDALERLRTTGFAELGPEATQRARALYEAELGRVGSLEIRTATPRAVIQIDNVDVARTPAPPLRVTAGSHFVSISAAGYEPRHLKVTVAGRAEEVLDVELTPLEEAPAKLGVKCNVPAVEVRAGAQVLGRTPLRGDLLLKAGSHELQFRRDGYAPVQRRLTLHAGARHELEIQMAPRETGLRSGGTLALSISEDAAVVSVDGQPQRSHALGLRLPLGLHTVRVQRAGFFDVVRDVEVRPGINLLDATLLPTSDYLDGYTRQARNQRVWSYVALGAGGLVAAGSGAFLIWNQGQKNDAERDFDAYAGTVKASPNGVCPDDACVATLQILTDDLDAKRDRDLYGFIGLGVGAAAITTGVLLYALGEDPGRYDPKPESDVLGSIALAVGRDAISLRGTF